MIVADTDVLIDFLQGISPGADRIEPELEHGRLATTAVSRFKLFAGARSTRQKHVIGQVLDALVTLPLDSSAADRAAEIRRTLEKAGQGIGMGDSLIAGTVVARDGVLLTRNVRHFERVAGLSLGRLTE